MREYASRSARVSARRSKLARRFQAPCELARYLAQTAPVLASARFVGQKLCSARSKARFTRHLLAPRLSWHGELTKRGGASRGGRLCVVLADIATQRGAAITEAWGWGSPSVWHRDVEPRRVLSRRRNGGRRRDAPQRVAREPA